MNKNTLQNLINGEHDMLTTAVDLFRKLLPHKVKNASVHSGEEGRFIEMVLAEYLREKLPKGIAVGGGFIVDLPSGWVSKQIDIILYDSIKFAPLLKYGEAVVVPIESVIGAISVKRTLYNSQLSDEFVSLSSIGARATGMNYPKPLLALVAFEYEKDEVESGANATFKALADTFAPRKHADGGNHLYSWNELVDYVVVFDKFIVRTNGHSRHENIARKTASVEQAASEKNSSIECRYVWAGNQKLTRNAYIQHLLNGVHRAWYDRDRGNLPTRDLLAFPQTGMKSLGSIPICVYCRPYAWDNFVPETSGPMEASEADPRDSDCDPNGLDTLEPRPQKTIKPARKAKSKTKN